MIDALQSLWRELLGSWWVLVLLPVLVVVRWILSSRWLWVDRFRKGFFSVGAWDYVLSPPAEIPASTASQQARRSESSNGHLPGANGAESVGSGDDLPAENTDIAALTPVVETHEYRRRWFLELVESALVALFLVFFVIRPFVVQAFYIPSPSMVETLEVNDRILVNKFIYRIHAPRRGDVVVFQPPPRATDKVGDDWIKRVIGVPGSRISVHDNTLYVDGVAQKEPYVALLERGTDQPGMSHESTGRYTYTFPDSRMIDVPLGQNAYVYPETESAAVQEGPYRIVPTADASPRPLKGDGTGDYLFFVRNDPKDGLEIIVPPGAVFVMGDNRNDSEDSHFWGYLDQRRVLGQAFAIFWPLNRARLLTNPHND